MGAEELPTAGGGKQVGAAYLGCQQGYGATNGTETWSDDCEIESNDCEETSSKIHCRIRTGSVDPETSSSSETPEENVSVVEREEDEIRSR